MPHLFVNRSRILDLTSGTPKLRRRFGWETANTILYKIGGLVFIIGSVWPGT
jgi:hypothetical protein